MLSTVLAAALFLSPADDPTPPQVGIAVTQAAGESFPDALEAARLAGMQTVSLPLKWSELETSPGEFRPDVNWLEIAAASYPAVNVSCCVELNPIDTNTVCVPPDLAGKAWDDPELVARYLAALDWVVANLGDLDVPSLALGNEVDATLSSTSEIAAYARLVDAARKHVQKQRADLSCAAKITYGGLTGPLQREFVKLAGAGDVSLVTYYPLEPDFTVRPPAAVGRELSELLETLPPGPVQFAEIGYPSGAACDSSPAQQAAFVREVYQFWRANPERVDLMMFTWLTDIGDAEADEYTRYYRVPTPAFKTYLSTLGLRTHRGRPKPAYKRLKLEAARGL